MFIDYLTIIRKAEFFKGAQAGMYVAVLSAIEIALWDLAGKALNVPVYRLLGGKFRDKIRVYYDTVFYAIRNPQPKDYVDAGKKGVEMGFNAIKYDVDEWNDPNKYDRTTGQQALESYKEWKIKLRQQGKR